MSGQYAHFAFYAAKEHQYPYAQQRYLNEMNRQLGVMDRHLSDKDHFVADYSIADIALLPYALSAMRVTKAPRPQVQAWIDRLCSREQVNKGLALMQEQTRSETIGGGMAGYGEEHRDVLFGERQFAERE